MMGCRRIVVPLESDRDPSFDRILAPIDAPPGCMILLYIEDETALKSPVHMRRYLRRHLGDLFKSRRPLIEGNILHFPDLSAQDEFAREVLVGLVAWQPLFVMVFGAAGIRDMPVDWISLYQGRNDNVAESLRPKEVAVARANLWSQDVFELRSMRADRPL